MFDLSIIPDYPERADLFVKSEFPFLTQSRCPRVGWDRLDLVHLPEGDAIRFDENGGMFFAKARTEDDLQHSAHCMLIPVLLDLHFRAYLPTLDFYGLVKALAFHDVIEIYTGDIAASEANPEKRRLKKLNDEKLTEEYILSSFPIEAHGELLLSNHIFNNVDGEYTETNTAGVIDAFAFPFRIAHAIKTYGVNDWLSPKQWMEITKNPFDKANYELSGTSYALDAVYAGLLRGKLRRYEYLPLFIALMEAHYRAIQREVPARLRGLYPYEIV